MTDDLVARLRGYVAREWPGTLTHEAADEIERLRAEVAEAKTRRAVEVGYGLVIRANNAEAKRDALRSLLREARDDVEETVNRNAQAWGARLMDRQQPAINRLKRIDAAIDTAMATATPAGALARSRP